MNAEQFTFWLQGFVEMNPNAMLTPTQWEIVKDHLKLVFNKVTPQRQQDSGIRQPVQQPIVPSWPGSPIPAVGPRQVPDNLPYPKWPYSGDGRPEPYKITCSGGSIQAKSKLNFQC